jgi:hypothetical protein
MIIEAHILELPYHQQRRRVGKNTKNLTCARAITQFHLLPSLPLDMHRIYYLYDLVKWDPMEDSFFTDVTLMTYWALVSLDPQNATCSEDSLLTSSLF